MNDFRGNFKRIEFGATPAKSTHTNEFQSSQRQKYEVQKSAQHSYIAKENITMVQKELYDISIPVRVKQQTEDWNTTLTLKMILQQSNQAHGQTLHLELTDAANYQFLQVLELTENDFVQLKSDQSLHVDFANFPTKLNDLLQLCMGEREKVSFYVALETRQGESNLAVIENNEFKRLTHLSLRFRTATDETLKNFLSQKLSQSRVENEDLNRRNKRIEDALQERLWEIDNLRAELRKFQEERDSTVQQLLLEEQRKVNDLKENYLSKETLFIRESDTEKRLIIDKYERIVNDLQSRCQQLQNSNQELNDFRNDALQQERDFKQKILNLTTENSQLLKEVQELRIGSKELDNVKYTQERQLIELRIQKESLEKILSEKESYLQSKQALVENEKRSSTLLEEQLASQKKQIEKLEGRLQICSDEVNKGNQIIEKLQADLSKQKEKIKLKNQVVLQQEQTVSSLQDANDIAHKTLNDAKREKDQAELKFREADSINQDLKHKLAESQKLIESNNQMIQYLNKCLNESKSTPMTTTMPAMSQFKSQTFTKYTPLQEDLNLSNAHKSFQNPSQQQNISQLSNATITNRFNF